MPVWRVSFDMDRNNTRLLIVYNADGGILNALVHAVHKTVFPATYPCSLCAVTYGTVSMRKIWKKFLDNLPMEKVFHHRDDFAAEYPGHSFPLPAILIRTGENEPELLLGPEQLDLMTDVSELIAATELQIAQRKTAEAA
ncbi:MAG: hypothetical protein ABJP48_13340 [Erythrobacter sp.]